MEEGTTPAVVVGAAVVVVDTARSGPVGGGDAPDVGGVVAVVVGATVVGVLTGVRVTTSGGDSSLPGSWGVGSNDTQPAADRCT